jgi:hypothetical protein
LSTCRKPRAGRGFSKMHAVNISNSIDNLRSYEINGWIGATSAGTTQLERLVQPYLDAWREIDNATSKPDSLEIAVEEVAIGGDVVLHRREPLVLRASLCAPDECYRAEVPGLELRISAYCRDELIDALRDLIAALWIEYALEDDANLTGRGKRLKARLLRDYREAE